jgi:Raf kinase inhibitor-like YbhB/YbcL family protein
LRFKAPAAAAVRTMQQRRVTSGAASAAHPTAEDDMALELSSPAFSHNGPIPQEHTCDGSDRPPPLQWSGVPAGTASLALIVDDPDAPDPAAPQRTYVHWVLYDLPPDTTSAAPDGSPLPAGTRHGLNDWNRIGYGGPCPPIGRHRYFFKLYALDTRLGDLGQPTKAELERAMRDHILERTELVGTYERTQR